jgi:hypothetical protein
VVFVLFYSKEGKNDETSVVVSILLGLISFALSLTHAIQAKTSNVNMKKIEEKIRIRKNDKEKDFESKVEMETNTLLEKMKDQIIKEKEERT